MSWQSKQSCSAARVSIPLGRGLRSPQQAIHSTISSVAYQRPTTSARRKASTRARRFSLGPAASIEKMPAKWHLLTVAVVLLEPCCGAEIVHGPIHGPKRIIVDRRADADRLPLRARASAAWGAGLAAARRPQRASARTRFRCSLSRGSGRGAPSTLLATSRSIAPYLRSPASRRLRNRSGQLSLPS
jgi:hypothetical protein